MSELQKRTQRRLFAGVLAGAIVAGAWCVAAADASKVVPVKGTVKLSNMTVVGPAVPCQGIRVAAAIVKPEFDATLTWGKGKVDVSSPGGEFSCSLRGTQDFVGSSACKFYVGGGGARTQVSCAAANVTGNRAGDGL